MTAAASYFRSSPGVPPDGPFARAGPAAGGRTGAPRAPRQLPLLLLLAASAAICALT